MKKIFYIPPITHLYNLPKFIKDEKISTATKISVVFENVFLYLFAGIISGISGLKIWMFFTILLFAFLLSPFEWELIKFVRKRIKNSITNWENFIDKESYYFLQFQLMGYVVLGYIISTILISL
jgi:hypothetical protein